MTEQQNLVYIVDDDARLCRALQDLLDASGLNSVAFNSTAEYLAFSRPELPGCLILDVYLPDVTGLEFLDQIERHEHPPVVFITGYGDVPSTVHAMKRGAIDFLVKPFDDTQLLRAIHSAIDYDRNYRAEKNELIALRERFASLTPREREVLPLVVGGLLNKQAAAQLGISAVTMQIHRGRVMQKMNAASLADLVRMAGKLDIPLQMSRRGGQTSL
jgi:FixJ family two-component response regulator